MTEERFENLERRLDEIMRLISNLMTQNNNLQNQFADVVRVVIETGKKVDKLEQEFNEFRQETRENFERVFRELNVTNRRVDLLSPTVL